MTPLETPSARRRFGSASKILLVLIPCVILGAWLLAAAFKGPRSASPSTSASSTSPSAATSPAYNPRKTFDTSGYASIVATLEPWRPDATLAEISQAWTNVGMRAIETLDRETPISKQPEAEKLPLMLSKAMYYHYEGKSAEAYKVLEQARALAESKPSLAVPWLYSFIYYQGVSSLRRGEDENCVMCRGESSCILPISPAARHLIPGGSRLAIKHFTEYLKQFPDDLEVRWLLNIAYMTLGEYPEKVDPRFLVSLERWANSEFDLGRFRDIGQKAGVNRFNQAGGAIMEDFDNDGLLDLTVTSWDPTLSMAFYRNKGDGTFEDRTASSGLTGQLGGLNLMQADFDNDGLMDIFVPRGAWFPLAIRPSLLRNTGGGVFEDVTEKAGMLEAMNSNSAAWADYDNDGLVDLFVCCERQANRLYHNKGDGLFEEVASQAGVYGEGRPMCKGAAWIDYDNDGDPDLFLNYLVGSAQLYQNDGKGAFTSANLAMDINGPRIGFTCWAWDYDNDGWLDLFATSYDRTVKDVVKGLIGQKHGVSSNKLYRNAEGKGFVDKTKEAGLDMTFSAMGSNVGDFDNDGFLDMYLGTGEPGLTMLVPNRMFKNVEGKRFAEITASTGTGHLQKGHAVACGDWDRDGDIDIFEQMGGATNGDRYHNVLFDNPGQGNHWLTVKLVGKKTNRAAIGARIKVVTAGEKPLTVHRHVSSGSSFGSNPLRQTIGLAKADKIASLEIQWPTSGTTQVFRDIQADQAIEVTELSETYRALNEKPIPAAPESETK